MKNNQIDSMEMTINLDDDQLPPSGQRFENQVLIQDQIKESNFFAQKPY